MAVKPLKFDLINPTNPLWRVEKAGKPRGPRAFRFSMLPSLYVAAAMPDYVRTRIIDEDVEPVDFETDADIVGISFMTYNAPRAYEIADRFRGMGRPVIFGGYHPTFLPEEAVQHADAVCIGEAEYNVPRMMADFVAGTLQPFYDSDPVDLKYLPIPDRTLLRRSSYIAPDMVQATRGCPHRCAFCSIAAFNQFRFRTRPIDDVVEELKTVGRWVIFMDDQIIGDREYARELFARMIPLGKRWVAQCGIRIAYDDDLLRLAAASGCKGLFVGFESLSQDNLDAMRKGPNRAADFTRVIDRLHRAGIGVFAGIVFGMDEDRPDVFPKTLRFLLDAKVDALQATSLTPFPGTPLYDQMERAGRIFDREWSHYDFGHVVFEPRHMAPRTLERGTAWVLDRFYSRKASWRRILRAFGSVGPAATIRAVAPLNIGYRTRLSRYGTLTKGRSFEPDTTQPTA